MLLAHEKLDVYRVSIKFVAYTLKVIRDVPRGNADFTGQLRKSASSIPANISEGVGKTSEDDKKRFFAIARGSAMESAAHYDVLHVAGLIRDEHLAVSKKYIFRIVGMLSKLCL